jgi:tRNA (guanine37-N1)-methyltransferase
VTLELDVFTLFPDAFDWLARSRPVRNASEAGSLRLRIVDLRDFALGPYRAVDGAPYGGGAGMVIRVDVVCAALEGTYGAPIDRVRAERRVVVLTPAGRQLTDAVVDEYAGAARVALLCGRYEGFDQRVHDHLATEELSIGPYVLAGGEVAAMAVTDAVARKLPGALGKAASAAEESFSASLAGGVEYPHYTRPEEFRGWRVPAVLLSGHHAQVEAWRRRQVRPPATGSSFEAGEGVR